MTEIVQEHGCEAQENSHQAAENNRRERRMNRRRREVLEVAARLFAQVGYEATTLEMIAAELGLSKPGLYYYIKSKEDVLVQIHEDILHNIIEGVQSSITPQMPPDERLWRLIVAHVVSHCSHPARRALLLFRGHLDSERAQDVVALRDRYQKFVEAILQEGIAQGVFRVTSAKLAAFALLGALNWIPNWYSPAGPLSLEEIGEYFANILVSGLKNPQPFGFSLDLDDNFRSHSRSAGTIARARRHSRKKEG
ncbi:MAG: TetR family transcriptional regulator [Ktedonobacteraceae bacterium]|nr:TetR family transcriptional regulator [Ktedonobacteraceae bacterium]